MSNNGNQTVSIEVPPTGVVAATTREVTKIVGEVKGMSSSQVINLIFILFSVFIGITAGIALYELKDVMIRTEKRSDDREAEGYRWQVEQAEKNRKFTADERAKDRQVLADNIAALKKLEATVSDNIATLKKVEGALTDLSKAIMTKKQPGIMD